MSFASYLPLFSSGIDLLGGFGQALFGSSSAKKQAKKARKFAKKQLKYQKFLDTHRIQLTVADAKKAGIHPLAALGASSIGGFSQPVPYSGGYDGGGWGDAIGAGASALSRGLSSLYDDFQLGEDRAAQREAEAYRRSRDLKEDYFRHGETRRADDAAFLMAKQARLNERLVESQIEEATSRTRLNQMRAASIGGPILNPGGRAMIDPLGNRIPLAPTTDAQEWSDRYGDILGEAFGVGNFIRDLFEE